MSDSTDPFFLVGVPRSGNTLLGVLLNNHPSLFVGAASTAPAFFTGYEQHRLPFDADLRHATPAAHALDRLRDEPRLAALLEGVTPAAGQSLQDLLHTATHRRAQEAGKQAWGDKAIGEQEYMPSLRFYFPHARFVHLIRDGRAVAASLEARQHVPLKLGMHYWKRQVAHGRLHGAFLGPAAYHEVHYEALVRDPEATLVALCAFLQVPYEARMLTLADIPATQTSTAYVAPRLDPGKIDAWAKQLTAGQVEGLEALGGDLLQALGYPLRAYPLDGPFQALTPLAFLRMEQQRHARTARLARKTVVRDQQLLEVRPSLRRRLRRLAAATAANWLHPRLVKHFGRSRPMV